MRAFGGFTTRGAIFIAAIVLSGCSNAPPKLSADEETLFDAVAYLFAGLEDNVDAGNGRAPWTRTKKGRSVEYWRVGENRIGSSDEEFNRKTQNSRFVRYRFKLTSPQPCAFSFEDITDFSNGKSRKDFSVYSSTSMLNTMTFDFASAHTLEYEDSGFGDHNIRIVGPRVVCTDPVNVCENAWNSQFSGLLLDRPATPDNLPRKVKALAIIKSSCPGKKF